jgi:hypothetical protein
MTVADREADIDVPFDTILDNLDLVLDMDYVSGGGVREADLDIRLSGPQLGIVFSF